MRVLLSTIGTRGDVQPLVALGVELRSIGHDAAFCVPPDFKAWIEGLGFIVTTIGPELRSLARASAPAAAPTPMSAERRRDLAEASVAAQFDAVSAAAKGCEAIVAATALQIAARSVAESLRIPYRFVAYCPAVLPSALHAPPPLPPIPGEVPLPAEASNLERWERDTERFNGLFGPALNAHRARLGFAPVDDVRRHLFGDQPWLAADRVLAPWPDSSELVYQPGAWVLRDDRPLDREVEAFLDAGEPPVYFGFGSMRAPSDLSQVMMQSARALGRRAILSRGWADLAFADSSDCLVIGDVNQQALFTRVAAIVHHGGAGTTTAAALGGAPQVIVPQSYDQHYFADRIAALGVGVAHVPGTPTAESLTAALDQALQPAVASRAATLGGAISLEGARTAATRLCADAC